MLRRRSLARLRHEVEPVDPGGRSAGSRRRGRGSSRRRSGADALLDAIEQLQGAPLPASILETEILPARLDALRPGRPRRRRRGRRGRVGRRRAARRPRRARGAVPRRSSAGARAAGPRAAGAGRARATAPAGADPRLPERATARRSSPRCTTRPAAAIPPRRSTRSGRSPGSGLVTNDTFAGAARVHRGARAAPPRTPRRAGVPLAAPGAALGRGTMVARRARGGDRRRRRRRWSAADRRSSCSPGTAC